MAGFRCSKDASCAAKEESSFCFFCANLVWASEISRFKACSAACSWVLQRARKFLREGTKAKKRQRRKKKKKEYAYSSRIAATSFDSFSSGTNGFEVMISWPCNRKNFLVSGPFLCCLSMLRSNPWISSADDENSFEEVVVDDDILGAFVAIVVEVAIEVTKVVEVAIEVTEVIVEAVVGVTEVVVGVEARGVCVEMAGWEG